MLLSILSNLTSWNMVPSIYFAMMNLKSIFITISLDILCRTKTERFKTEHILIKEDIGQQVYNRWYLLHSKGFKLNIYHERYLKTEGFWKSLLPNFWPQSQNEPFSYFLTAPFSYFLTAPAYISRFVGCNLKFEVAVEPEASFSNL